MFFNIFRFFKFFFILSSYFFNLLLKSVFNMLIILYFNFFIFSFFVPLLILCKFTNFNDFGLDYIIYFNLDYINPLLILLYVYIPLSYFFVKINFFLFLKKKLTLTLNKKLLLFICLISIFIELNYYLLNIYSGLVSEIIYIFIFFILFYFILFFIVQKQNLNILILFFKFNVFFKLIYKPLFICMEIIIYLFLLNFLSFFFFLLPSTFLIFVILYICFFKFNIIDIEFGKIIFNFIFLVKEQLDAILVSFFFDDNSKILLFKNFIICWLNLDYRLFCLFVGYSLTVFSIFYLMSGLIVIFLSYVFFNNAQLKKKLKKENDYSKKINLKYNDLVLKKKKMSTKMFNYLLMKKKIPLNDIESYYDKYLNKQFIHLQKGFKIKL